VSDALTSLLASARTLPFEELVVRLEQRLGPAARVGGDAGSDRARIRFRHDPALCFHESDVVEARLVPEERGGLRVDVTTSFLGLTGAVSPLPPLWIEALARDDDGSAVEGALLDIFHDRILRLLYRGLRERDVTDLQGGHAFIETCSLLLGGLLPSHAERLTGLGRADLMRLAPLLVAGAPSAQRLALAVRTVLEDVLEGASVQVREWTGGYVRLEPAHRARLGHGMRLGGNTLLGARLAAPASAITLEIGPLCPLACARLGPGEALHVRLRAVIALFAPETVQVAVRLQPRSGSAARLGGTARPRLGRGTWLGRGARPAPLRFTFGEHA